MEPFLRFQPAALGRSGLKVSSAVMGTMTFGGETDEEESRRLFDLCLDRGIFTFDCANVYNGGRSEELLGRFTEGRRQEVVIATKACLPTGKGPNDRGASRRHLIASVEDSLKRLRTDWIDLFFVHRFDEGTPLEETVSTLEALMFKGAIRYAGLSNVSAWQALKAHGLARQGALGAIACIQPMYNLLKRQCECEILPMAMAEGMAVLSYSPLAAGLLTGKFHGDAPKEARLAVNAMYQRRYDSTTSRARLDAYLALCQRYGLDPAQLAIAWVRDNRAVTAPILGARSVSQLERQLPFMSVKVTPALRTELDAIFAPPAPATDRSEEPAVAWGRAHATE